MTDNVTLSGYPNAFSIISDLFATSDWVVDSVNPVVELVAAFGFGSMVGLEVVGTLGVGPD